jgi:hypothetical protein
MSDFAGKAVVISETERAEAIAAGVAPEDVVLALRRVERPRRGHRNENTAARAGARGEVRVLIAEGDGATILPDRPPAEDAARA